MSWWCKFCEVEHPGTRMHDGCPNWWENFNALIAEAAAKKESDS
jgi:hypothetical protein